MKRKRYSVSARRGCVVTGTQRSQRACRCRCAGTAFSISFTPHSVDLYHADHVGNMGSPPREDIVLKPRMVLSVDCPMGATGMGGSYHLEDLMLITEDGAEPINSIGTNVVRV